VAVFKEMTCHSDMEQKMNSVQILNENPGVRVLVYDKKGTHSLFYSRHETGELELHLHHSGAWGFIPTFVQETEARIAARTALLQAGNSVLERV